MARLPNDRNEQYARHRARGMNAAKSALAAGYAPGSSTTHLENDPDIQARIGELMDEFKAQREQQRQAATEAAKVVGQMTGVGRAWVVEKLAENAQNAAREGAFKESNEALKLIGEEFGMFQGRAGDGDGDGSPVPKTLNLDSLEQVLDHAQQDLPKPEPTSPDHGYGEETALSLIEGQTKRGRRADQPMQWVEIDPDTPPEELLDMALGKTPPRQRDNRVPAAERGLTTGSETDVALLDPEEIARLAEEATSGFDPD